MRRFRVAHFIINTMNCKLTKSLNNRQCSYAIAGARAVYLLNFYPANIVTEAPEEPVPNMITYVEDADGKVTQVLLPTGESFYAIDSAAETISATDALQVSQGKYRLHTVNATINRLDNDVITEMDALSLGRFVAVVVDNAGQPRIYGRLNGLTAPADGVNDTTGAAATDTSGVALILSGAQTETLKFMTSEAVVTPVQRDVVIP